MEVAKKSELNLVSGFYHLVLHLQVNFDEAVMEKSMMTTSEQEPLPSSQDSQFDINPLVEFPVLSCVPITRK